MNKPVDNLIRSNKKSIKSGSNLRKNLNPYYVLYYKVCNATAFSKKRKMRNITRRITQALIIGSLVIGSAAMTGCKKKKELAAAQAAEAIRLADQIKDATAILEGILSDNTLDNIDLNYEKLALVKEMNLEDPGVLNLIIQAQEKLANDKEAYAVLMEEERLAAEVLRLEEAALAKIENDKMMLNQYFAALTGEKDYDKANNIINNTLPMFANADVPVLTIIAEENGEKDYDKPTTIKKYLNYLKDRKAYNAEVESVVYDDAGKITELELRKK